MLTMEDVFDLHQVCPEYKHNVVNEIVFALLYTQLSFINLLL